MLTMNPLWLMRSEGKKCNENLFSCPASYLCVRKGWLECSHMINMIDMFIYCPLAWVHVGLRGIFQSFRLGVVRNFPKRILLFLTEAFHHKLHEQFRGVLSPSVSLSPLFCPFSLNSCVLPPIHLLALIADTSMKTNKWTLSKMNFWTSVAIFT